MDKVIIYIGLDVHKDTIAVALADGERRSEVREHGRIANTPTAAQLRDDASENDCECCLDHLAMPVVTQEWEWKNLSFLPSTMTPVCLPPSRAICASAMVRPMTSRVLNPALPHLSACAR